MGEREGTRTTRPDGLEFGELRDLHRSLSEAIRISDSSLDKESKERSIEGLNERHMLPGDISLIDVTLRLVSNIHEARLRTPSRDAVTVERILSESARALSLRRKIEGLDAEEREVDDILTQVEADLIIFSKDPYGEAELEYAAPFLRNVEDLCERIYTPPTHPTPIASYKLK